MYSRRRLLATIPLAAVPLAGCSGIQDSYEFTATKASIPDSALSDSPWSKANENSPSFSESVSVAGQDVEVSMNSHVVNYEADFQGAPLAFATLLATPQGNVAGESLNPIGRLSGQDLIERALSRAGELREASKEGETEVEILGETETVERYNATTQENSQRVRILLTRVADGEDYVIAAAVFPLELSGGEEETLDLFRAIEH